MKRMKMLLLVLLVAGLAPAYAQEESIEVSMQTPEPEQEMLVTTGQPVVTTTKTSKVTLPHVNKATRVWMKQEGYKLASMTLGSDHIIVPDDAMIAQANRNTDKALRSRRFSSDVVYNGSRLITEFFPADKSLARRIKAGEKASNQPRVYQLVWMWFDHLHMYLKCVVEPGEVITHSTVPLHKVIIRERDGSYKALNIFRALRAFRCGNALKGYYFEYEQLGMVEVNRLIKTEVTATQTKVVQKPGLVLETCPPEQPVVYQAVQRPHLVATFGPTGQSVGGIRSGGGITISNTMFQSQRQSQRQGIVINPPGGGGGHGPGYPGSPGGPPPNTTPPNPPGGAYGDGGVGQYGSQGNPGTTNGGVEKPNR